MDDNQSDQVNDVLATSKAPETTEGKRARYYRGQVYGLLEELVLLMEQARADGFIVQFSIPQTADGANVLEPSNLAIIKKW